MKVPFTKEWCERMATLEGNASITAGTHAKPLVDVCRVPPEGWYCTRAPEHDGPCAALPLPPNAKVAPTASAVCGGSAPTPCLADLRAQEDAAEEVLRAQWNLGDYDNGESGCPNCGRSRLCQCPNGRHRCEKCNWCPELNDYAPVDDL